jgi:hypothetical protein
LIDKKKGAAEDRGPMDSAEAVAAKRRVLIDALMMCLGKSRVVQVVDGKTVRGVLNSASQELWREGEFRLEPVWRILVQQPGLTAEDVAPPLLVFKAYESELGVAVRAPQALTAIPRGEQVRLRDGLGIQRADFQRAIEELRAIADATGAAGSQARLVREAESSVSRKSPLPAPPSRSPSPQRRRVARLLALGGVVAAAFSTWLALRDTSTELPLGDVAGTLQLSTGRAVGPSLTATITDGRWEAWSPEERKKAAAAVMDVEAQKGVRSLILLDASGAPRAMVTETPTGRSVVLQ